jgi:hypothetical protein
MEQAYAAIGRAVIASRCIATLNGPDQIEMGRRVLETALRNPGHAADPKTEPSL